MSIILAEGIGVRNVRQRWSFSFITATLIAFIFIFPIASIVWLSFSAETLQWRHLMSTVLPRYLANSLVLMAGVGFVSLFLGTSLAGADGGSGLRKPIFGYLFGVFGYKYKIPWSQGYKVCIVPAFDDAIIYCGLCLG